MTLVRDVTDEEVRAMIKENKLYDKDMATQIGMHYNTLLLYKKRLPVQILNLICIANICGYDLKLVKKGATVIWVN